MEELKSGIKNINKWCEENLADNTDALEKAESYINMQNLIGSLASSLSEYTQLFMSVDAENEQAAKVMDSLENIISDMTGAQTAFEKWFASLNIDDKFINGSPVLKEHEFLLKEMLKNSRHLLSRKEEEHGKSFMSF